MEDGTVGQGVPDLHVGTRVGVLGEFFDHAAVDSSDGRVHGCRHVNALVGQELTGNRRDTHREGRRNRVASLGQRPVDRVGQDLHVAVAVGTSTGFATGDCDGCFGLRTRVGGERGVE